MKYPHLLYYATVTFASGVVESPHYLVFEDFDAAATIIKEHYKNLYREPVSIELKELLFIDTAVLPEDAYVLVPSNDFGLEDDFHDPITEQDMVDKAEEDDPEDAMMLIFPDKQEHDDVEAYYRGPFFKAKSPNDFIKKLQEEPFQVSQPEDFVLLYRPTGETRTLKRQS